MDIIYNILAIDFTFNLYILYEFISYKKKNDKLVIAVCSYLVNKEKELKNEQK
jgi:predicted GNAT family acetyltransferase